MTHPRAVIGVPEPPASRARLRGVGWLLAHEVGVNTPPTGRYRSADPARVLDDARAVAAYGASSGRTWEYTGMIGLDGSRFTQAGEYTASHCRDFNAESAGLVFLNAVDVPVTAAQVASWHQWRDELVAAGVLAANHTVAPHYRFRSTACPGIRAEPPGKAWPSPTGEGRLGELIPALRTRPTPSPPTPTGDDMPFMWRDARYANVFLVGSCPAQNISGKSMEMLTAKGVPLVVDQHDQFLATCLHQSGLTAAALVPA